MNKLVSIICIGIAVLLSTGSAQAQQLQLLVEIQWNNPHQASPQYASWGLEILGDINNDGHEDVVVLTNSVHPSYPTSTLILDGRTGGVLATVPIREEQSGFRDFDRDGIVELIILHSGFVKVYKWVELPVPVSLSSFNAERYQDDVIIRWEVNDFVYDEVEFRVFRDDMEITQSPLSGEKSYEFVDKNAPLGEVNYLLEESGASGVRGLHGPIKVGKAPMSPVSLTAHPNPFNPTVNISYTVAERSTVSLEVYDVQGKLVRTLVNNERREPKQYEITFRPEKASGVYFVRLESGGQVKTMKVVMIK